MEDGGVSSELRSSVARNQALIDCLLTRRANEERRIDLYQRIISAQDAERGAVEAAAAAVQKELLTALEKLYALQHQQRQPAGRSSRLLASTSITAASPLLVSPAQQLRTSLVDTQRFNEALRMELVRHASHCDVLKKNLHEKQIHCSALEDQLAIDCARRIRAAPSSSCAASASHISHMACADDEATCFADALLIDTTQFYQRAFAAARDTVVEYIALQDELRVHLQRAPLQGLAGTSFEASMLNSVQLFANTYTQLRRQEQAHYEEVLSTVTRLLRKPAEES